MSYSEPKSIDEFNTFISNADVTIVDFYTPWCGPCKKFAPAFSAYANNNTQESKLHFMKLPVDNEILHSIAQKYKITDKTKTAPVITPMPPNNWYPT